MRKLWLIAGVFATAELLTMGQPRADESQLPVLELSLEQVVNIALERNPALGAVRESLSASLARLGMARAEGRPQASTSIFLSDGTMPGILAGSRAVMPQTLMAVPDMARADFNLMAMYPLSTGGRVAGRVGSAQAQADATRARVQAAVLDTVYLVRAAYWKALYMAELVKVHEQNLQEQRERLRLDQAAFETGRIPFYYVLRDRAETAAAEQALTDAQRDAATALYELCTAMGVEPTSRLHLTDKLIYEPSGPTDQEEVLVSAALENRPELRAAEATVESARQEVRARQASYRFQVQAMVMLDEEKVSTMPGRGGYTAGVVASLPLVDGGERRAGVEEAQAMLRQAEKERAAVVLEIQRQVRSAFLERRAAEQNVRAAMEAVAAAEEDYRVALLRYREGRAINLEPISALAVLVNARSNLARALFEFNVASDALRRAVGQMP